MTEKIKPARVRIGSASPDIRPQRYANRDPFPQLPFEHDLIKSPIPTTALEWTIAIAGLVVLLVATWGTFG